MRQMTFAAVGAGFERYAKTTRRAAFLAEMDKIVPWAELCASIEPYYPKAGNGRPPIPLERMLRIHFLQHWFNLSDPAAEEALYESSTMRAFAGIDLGREAAPDETTICRFRHLLEAHDLGAHIFEAAHRHLGEKGLKVSTGTIVDATIIHAPSSTKNAEQARDPEMHQTKKGNQWYFGMKAHVGVDSRLKLIHAVVATPANVHDGAVLGDLLHGEEGVSGAIRPIAARGMSLASTPRVRKTSPTAAIATVGWSTRPSAPGIARSLRCAPKSSIRSACSSACSAL
jgi:IS5 family transposase